MGWKREGERKGVKGLEETKRRGADAEEGKKQRAWMCTCENRIVLEPTSVRSPLMSTRTNLLHRLSSSHFLFVPPLCFPLVSPVRLANWQCWTFERRGEVKRVTESSAKLSCWWLFDGSGYNSDPRWWWTSIAGHQWQHWSLIHTRKLQLTIIYLTRHTRWPAMLMELMDTMEQRFLTQVAIWKQRERVRKRLRKVCTRIILPR